MKETNVDAILGTTVLVTLHPDAAALPPYRTLPRPYLIGRLAGVDDVGIWLESPLFEVTIDRKRPITPHHLVKFDHLVTVAAIPGNPHYAEEALGALARAITPGERSPSPPPGPLPSPVS